MCLSPKDHEDKSYLDGVEVKQIIRSRLIQLSDGEQKPTHPDKEFTTAQKYVTCKCIRIKNHSRVDAILHCSNSIVLQSLVSLGLSYFFPAYFLYWKLKSHNTLTLELSVSVILWVLFGWLMKHVDKNSTGSQCSALYINLNLRVSVLSWLPISTCVQLSDLSCHW